MLPVGVSRSMSARTSGDSHSAPLTTAMRKPVAAKRMNSAMASAWAVRAGKLIVGAGRDMLS